MRVELTRWTPHDLDSLIASMALVFLSQVTPPITKPVSHLPDLQLYVLPGTYPLGPSATINLYPLSPRVRRPWFKWVGARGHAVTVLIVSQTTTTRRMSSGSDCPISPVLCFPRYHLTRFVGWTAAATVSGEAQKQTNRAGEAIELSLSRTATRCRMLREL